MQQWRTPEILLSQVMQRGRCQKTRGRRTARHVGCIFHSLANAGISTMTRVVTPRFEESVVEVEVFLEVKWVRRVC